MSAAVYLWSKGPGALRVMAVPLSLPPDEAVLKPVEVAVLKAGEGFEFVCGRRIQALFIEELLSSSN